MKIGTIGGFRIVEDINMVEHLSKQVRRTFLERMFSFSWLEKYKYIYYTKPKTDVIQWKDQLIMHPETAQKLYKEMENNQKPKV